MRGFLTVIAVTALLAAGSGAGLAQEESGGQWVGTWATAPMLVAPGFSARPFGGTTLRQVVHISAGGGRIRIRFTNAYGEDPLTISDVHAGVSGGGSTVKEGTDHAVTFGGAPSVRIAPGAEAYSDPVALEVAPLSDVAVSLYLPNQVMRSETYHAFADQHNFLASGDVSASPSLDGAQGISSWYFLDGIDVPARENSRAVVAFGDSITDGSHSPMDANLRWPDVLARRLRAEHGLENVSVLNMGIGGNRVLNDGTGPSALSRLDRDVLAQNGVRYLIVLESINDIGRLARPMAPEDAITAADLKRALRQIADTAHQHGIKVFGATLTPYGGAGYSTEKGEQIREEVNDWIRTSKLFDGVVDFDRITQDQGSPKQFNPLYDSGDHLHPSDAGYKAMGEGVDLGLFRR